MIAFCTPFTGSLVVNFSRLESGIYFLHEYGYGIYVANIVPNSSASHCGMIANGDFLVQIDGVQLTAETSLEQVRAASSFQL